MRSLYVLMILVLFLTLSACSSSPDVTTPDSPAMPDEGIAQDWGTYGLQFDPATEEVEIIYDREAAIHYNIAGYLNPPACGGPGCITAAFVAWDPVAQIVTFNVSITNPTPWTPSDVRMIFYWLGGREIVNADSFTRAFVGSIEPFIAFGKANPNRTFPGAGTITETVQIYWPPLSPFTIWFHVSAWVWIGCRDPYEINGMFQTGDLYPSGGAATIGCHVLDWQSDVTSVSIDTTVINGGVSFLANVGVTQWEQGVTNSMGAPVGIYTMLITAASPNPQNFDLYNYIDVEVVVEPTGWIEDGTWNIPAGNCSLDLGIIANAFPGNGLMAGQDATGACNEIDKYPGWANPSVVYASLANLDPADPNFQPWPPVRIDAANDGAFGWTNNNSREWLPPPPFPILNLHTYCNFDNIPSFIWAPEPDDHRHYMIFQEWALTPVDCCDTFKDDQCALYQELGFGQIGFQGIPGAPFAFDYTDGDIIWEAFFPAALVGPEEGQVDPGDVVGIDARRDPDEDGVITVYIALKANLRVEVFDIIDMGPGPIDLVVHKLTIWTMDEDGQRAPPIDIELLPGSNDYEPAPGTDILCVLIDNGAWPNPPPGFGGSVRIYNANTGLYLDTIGDAVAPACRHQPLFLDTDDTAWAVHISQVGPFVTQITYH